MISVILPFYNSEKTIECAILSVVQQEGVQLELLLVNNNSTDQSLDIARKYQSTYPDWVSIQDEPRQGVVHAMNCGLSRARFDWVARMDADDEWLPDKLKQQWAYLQTEGNEGVEVVGTQVKYESDIEATIGFSTYVNWSNGILSSEDIDHNIFCESPIVNPSVLFKKGLITEYGLYQEGPFPEDYEMFLRWHSHGVRMAKVAKELMVWNDSNTRLTRTHYAYEPEAFNRVKCAYLAKWLKANTAYAGNIWVWGAGRKTRKKLEELEKHGIGIEGFIDLQANKTSVKPCISFADIDRSKNPFIVSFVSNRGKGNEIRQYLKSKSFIEMEHFVIAG